MSLLSFTKKIVGRGPASASKAPAGKRASEKKETKAKQDAPKEAHLRQGSGGQASQVETPAIVSVSGADWLDLIPLVTEKSVNRSGEHNTVAFRVGVSASKGQIARAVKARYGIAPVKVRTLTAMPKLRRRGVTTGQTSRWKKAYVSLPAGKTIDLTA